jgi:hypothetical protein
MLELGVLNETTNRDHHSKVGRLKADVKLHTR